MYKFERHTRTIITFSIMLIMLLLFLELLFWPRDDIIGNEITFSLVIIFVEALYVAIATVALVILPPDFDYNIQVHLPYIVIIFSEDDYRKLDRNFEFKCKKRESIILDDGTSRIKIAYNKELLEFLEEIQI